MNPEDLAKLMEQRDMDVNEVAEACSVTPDAVRKWLRGDRKIGKQVSTNLAHHLSGRKI